MPNTTRGYPYPASTDDVDVPADIQAAVEAINADVAGVETAFDAYTDAWRPGPRARATTATLGLGGTYLLPNDGATSPVSAGAAAHVARFGQQVSGTDFESGGLDAQGRISAYIANNAADPAVTFTFGLYVVTAIGGASGATPYISAVSLVAGSQTPPLSAGASAVDGDLSAAFSLPAGPLCAFGVVVSGGMAANSSTALLAELHNRLT